MAQSDDIKSKLDIVDVIREYIPLKPAGVNFRALCPFHREKSPSFVVSPEKQIWHCFGCSKGGDIFSFVMEMEGISFVDSLRNLAPKAGVTLKRQNPKLTSQRNRLLDIVEYARNYYHKILLESGKAESARKYLAERGLNEETIDEWQVGFSPDSWDDLINLLIKKGYKENEIFLAGMSVKKEGAGRFYNRFRGRIMFPINDVNGNTVAFSARVSPEKEKDEKMGKYINSPQTLVYDKSRILFGLEKAKQEIKKADQAIITEGQMDVITAHQNGYKNVVASSGTALTGEQVMLLKRYSNNIIFSFDMDKAGEMAVDRGIKESMQQEMNAKIIKLPNGKDPDECIKNNKEEWEEAVKNAKPIMQYYFDKIFTNIDLDEVENKREAARKLLPTISRIGNKIEQDFWIKKLSQTIDVREDTLRETLRQNTPKIRQKYAKNTSNNTHSEQQAQKKPVKLSKEEMLSELFLVLLFKFPSLFEYSINHLNADQVEGEENIGLYNNLVIYYNNLIDNWTQEGGQTEPPQVSYEGFRSWLKDLNNEGSYGENNDLEVAQEQGNQLKLVDKLVLLGDKDYFEFEIEQAKNEIIKIIIELKKYNLINRRNEINKLIVQAEKESKRAATLQDGGQANGAHANENNEGGIKNLMEEFKQLTDEIGEIER